MELASHTLSLTGPEKSRCGDHVLACVAPPGTTRFIALADGVGSHSHDWAASQRACESAVECFLQSATSPAERLLEALQRAHQDVADLQGAAAGATSTLILVAWAEDEEVCRYVSVGDSRLYRVTPAGVERLTADDTTNVPLKLHGELVLGGGSVRSAPALTRAVGLGSLSEVEVRETPFLNGDMIVAVTDGFSNLHGFEPRLVTIYQAPDIGRAIDGGLRALHGVQGDDDATIAALRRQRIDDSMRDECWSLVTREADADGATVAPHLLTRALVEVMGAQASRSAWPDLALSCAAFRRWDLKSSRAQLATVLKAFRDDGSGSALAAYREIQRLMDACLG